MQTLFTQSPPAKPLRWQLMVQFDGLHLAAPSAQVAGAANACAGPEPSDAVIVAASSQRAARPVPFRIRSSSLR